MGDYDRRMSELLIAVGLFGAIMALLAGGAVWAISKLLGR